ncbi:hypothetical protein DITRI_Ditri14bG0104300 [Diplodiscus trichospermus]
MDHIVVKKALISGKERKLGKEKNGIVPQDGSKINNLKEIPNKVKGEARKSTTERVETDKDSSSRDVGLEDNSNRMDGLTRMSEDHAEEVEELKSFMEFNNVIAESELECDMNLINL